MSHHKRQRNEDIKAALSTVKELLVTLKPLIRVPLLPNVPTRTLVNTLASISQQCERLSELCARGPASRAIAGGTGQSPSKARLPSKDQDLLDGEGVNIWNRSGEYKTQVHPGALEVFGALRHAGFRLIEAGYDGVFDATGATRLLVLGSKAAAGLALGGNEKDSASVLSKCAGYEDQVSKLPPSRSEGESQERARAVTQYYSARTESAFRTRQLDTASYMFAKATDERRVVQLGPKDIYDLIIVAQEVANHYLGPSLAERDGDQPAEVELAKDGAQAVDWLLRAARLGDSAARVEKDGHGGAKVKRATMTSLALAFVLSASVQPDNLEKAETVLDELLADPDLLRDETEASRTRWLKLECVRRRKAGDAKVIEAFKLIIDNDSLAEPVVDRILREIMHSKTGCSRPVATVVLQMLLNVLVQHRPDLGRLTSVTRTLLSISIHAKGSDNIDRGCRDIRTALDTVERHPAYKPEPAACAAYQTVFWQMGDAAYTANPPQYAEAAKCYDLGLHACLAAKHSTFPKIYRKVALCYIRLKDHERAMARIEACSPEESTTHYLRFLVYAQQGLEDAAVEALAAMTQSNGMNGKLLILATQLAYEAGLNTVVLASLQAILLSIRNEQFATRDVAVFVLIRSIIRLTITKIEEASSEGRDPDRDGFIDSLVHQFQSAVEIATKSVADNDIPPEKELAWLYKHAYNTAISGASQGWLEPNIYGLFDASVALMNLYVDTAIGVDPQVPWQRAMGSFAGLCSRMFEAKGMPEGEAKSAAMGIVARDAAQNCLGYVQPLLEAAQMSPDDRRGGQLASMSQVARVFQVESLSYLRAWNEAEAAIQEASSKESTASAKLFESLSNILWTSEFAPPDVTMTVRENLLRSSLSLDFFHSVDKFARWLRTVVTLLLQRGGAANVTKAIGYCAQSVEAIRAHAGSANEYPEEEVGWIFATAWNRGNEDYSTSNYTRAKQWVEISQNLLEFTNSSTAAQEQRLRSRYTELLGKSGGHAAPGGLR